MKNRILSIILCLSVVLSLLSACGKKPIDTSSTTKKPTTSDNSGSGDNDSTAVPDDESSNTSSGSNITTRTEYVEEKVPVLNDGEVLAGTEIPLYTKKGDAVFRVIRPANASNEIIGYASKIKAEIKERLKVTIEYKPDSVVERKGIMEVCVGETNREGYKEIYDEIVNFREKHLNDWTIKVVGDKIFIVGGSNVAIEYAVNYFIEKFCSSLGAIITSEYCYKYKHDMSNSFSINGNTSLNNYKIIMPKYNLSYIVGRELDDVSSALLRYNSAVVDVKTDKEAESAYEILVGPTNRGSAANITDPDKWQITVKDNKVYLEGGHDYSTAMAVLQFINIIKSGKSLKNGEVIKGSYTESIKSKEYDNYYRLTVSDEFEGDTLNTKFWKATDEPQERKVGNHGLWSVYPKDSGRSSANVSLRDGKLVGKGTYTDTDYWGFNVTSSDNFWFQYGLIEISARIPMGPGFWAGFWAVGSNANSHYTEFDFFESGADYDAIKMSCLKWPGADGFSGYNGVSTNLGESAKDKFTWYVLQDGEFNKYYHTIGMEWDENQYSMICDGRVLYSVDYSNNEDLSKAIRQLVYLRISLCVDFKSSGSGAHGSVPYTFSNAAIPGLSYWNETNEYIVEYFHLFQKPGQKLAFRNK